MSILKGLIGQDSDGRRLLIALVIGVPARPSSSGVVAEKAIKDHLFGPWPVIAAWLVGGVLVIWLAAERSRPTGRASRSPTMTWKQGLIIGVAQVLAMWPGTSRSLVTILAALAVGASLATAVEFSFLLGLHDPRRRHRLRDGARTARRSSTPTAGSTRSSAWSPPSSRPSMAVRWMVKWLQTRSLAVFGWERVVAAVGTVVLIVTGVIASGKI